MDTSRQETQSTLFWRNEKERNRKHPHQRGKNERKRGLPSQGTCFEGKALKKVNGLVSSGGWSPKCEERSSTPTLAGWRTYEVKGESKPETSYLKGGKDEPFKPSQSRR